MNCFIYSDKNFLPYFLTILVQSIHNPDNIDGKL